MLRTVSVARHCCGGTGDVNGHRALVGDALIDEVLALAADLKGVRVCHLNSTASGGGVAELLSRHLPLLGALGVEADWRLLHGQPEFFTVTKALHNALQGGEYRATEADHRLYLGVNEASAGLLETPYDVFIIHDPQPAALRRFAGPRGARWIWRCHIDSSSPNPEAQEFLTPYVQEYDGLVFTMEEFLLPGLERARAAFIPPAIDPHATKNMELPIEVCQRVLADYGIHLDRPLLLQVSRFDPWKDPLGVIRAYRLVKQEIPEVQLALIGAIAGDDPEGWDLLERVEEEAAKDPDLFVFTNLEGVGNMEVNAFQRGCDVVIQKSLREGFGLVVSEALWKEKAIVAGNAGGIPMQIPDGFGRYLVDTVEECARQIVELLGRPGERGDFGRAGRERVRQRFLLPRMVRDELRLIREVLDAGPRG